MFGRVDDDLVQLGEVGVHVIPSLAVAGQINAAPVVDGAAVDGAGHGIVERLLRGGVGLRGTRGQKTDAGRGRRIRIGGGERTRGVARHGPIRRLAGGADLENRAALRAAGNEVGRRSGVGRGRTQDVAVAVNLAVGEGDQAGDGIPAGFPGGQPTRVVIPRCGVIGPNRGVFIIIPRSRNGGVFERLGLHLKAEPARVFARGLADEAGVLVGVAGPHGEFLFQQNPIHIQRSAPAFVAIAAGFHAGEITG